MIAASKKERATATPIYFSDFFDVSTEALEEYGAFNVSLINDLPLFIRDGADYTEGENLSQEFLLRT